MVTDKLVHLHIHVFTSVLSSVFSVGLFCIIGAHVVTVLVIILGLSLAGLLISIIIPAIITSNTKYKTYYQNKCKSSNWYFKIWLRIRLCFFPLQPRGNGTLEINHFNNSPNRSKDHTFH